MLTMFQGLYQELKHLSFSHQSDLLEGLNSLSANKEARSSEKFQKLGLEFNLNLINTKESVHSICLLRHSEGEPGKTHLSLN